MGRPRNIRPSRGFTLIEMMIVISLMLILISVALPIYSRSILRTRESVLKQDLFSIRNVIDQYKLDKQKAPQALDDLVTAGYFKKIPVDPFTGQADWVVEQEDQDNAVDPQQLGINDIHSASQATSTEGTPYSGW
jgi:general secretion pathway protein G